MLVTSFHCVLEDFFGKIILLYQTLPRGFFKGEGIVDKYNLIFTIIILCTYCVVGKYYFIVESYEFSFFRDKRFFRRKAGKSRAGRTTQLVKSPGISRGFPAAERGGLMLSAIAAVDVGVGVSG